MRKSINRRTVLKSGTALAAATIAGVVHVQAIEANPDAKLIALGEAWEKQRDIYNAASSAFSDAELAAYTEYPKKPVKMDPSIHSFGELYTREQIERGSWWCLYKPEQREKFIKRALAALDKYEAEVRELEAQRQRIDDRRSVNELEQISIAEGDAFDAIEKEIRQTPAHTIEGILVKLIAWREYQCPSDINCVGRFVDSALEDAKRISDQTGGHHV